MGWGHHSLTSIVTGSQVRSLVGEGNCQPARNLTDGQYWLKQCRGIASREQIVKDGLKSMLTEMELKGKEGERER